MDELISQVTQRTGISENQAQQAVQVVVNFLKGRLPGPLASQLDNFVGGQSGGANLGNIGGQGGANLGNLGNLGGQGQQAVDDLGGMLGGSRP